MTLVDLLVNLSILSSLLPAPFIDCCSLAILLKSVSKFELIFPLSMLFDQINETDGIIMLLGNGF